MRLCYETTQQRRQPSTAIARTALVIFIEVVVRWGPNFLLGNTYLMGDLKFIIDILELIYLWLESLFFFIILCHALFSH